MFTKSVLKGSAKLFQRFAMVCLALIVLFGSLPVGKAYAWQYFGPTGRPGTVTIPTVYVSDLLIGGVRLFSLQSNTGPVVYRSPATTGAQNVMAIYSVQKWNGSAWVGVTQTGVFNGQIGTAQTSYRFPALNISPAASRGYFRVSWSFSWGTTTGASLGGTNVVSNLANDHDCLTPTNLCFTALGYFYHY